MKRLWRLTGLVCLGWLCGVSQDVPAAEFLTNTVALAADIAATDSFPDWLTVFNNQLYFSATESTGGYELWRSAGSNATRVADIAVGTASAFPSHLAVYDDALYFQANDTDHGSCCNGYELWKTDGTTTTLVTNLVSGSGSSFPQWLTAFNGALYFAATTPATGYELWRYNGSTVTNVADILPGSGSSFPTRLTVFQDALYFQATDGINGYELWKYDGTNATLAANLAPGAADSFPDFFTVVAGRLYFRATTSAAGYEVWSFDGTTATLAADIVPGAGSSFPAHFQAHAGALYVQATTAATGAELWQITGTNAVLAADVFPGTASGTPQHLHSYAGRLYLQAIDTTFGTGTGYELWQFDGTTAGLAANIAPGADSAYPTHLQTFQNALYFQANDCGTTGCHGYELWKFTSTILGATNIISAVTSNLPAFTLGNLASNAFLAVTNAGVLNIAGDLTAGPTGSQAAILVRDPLSHLHIGSNLTLHSAATLTITNAGAVTAAAVALHDTSALTLAGGSLTVTNLAGTALLQIGPGGFAFPSGTLTADQLTLSNGQPLRVGNGINPAYLELRGGDYHFSAGLIITNQARLRGAGILHGHTTVHGTWAPGAAAAVLVVSNTLVCGATAQLEYELGDTSGLTVIGEDLTLAGTLALTPVAGFGTGTYTLFTYAGVLTNHGLTVSAPPVGYQYQLDTATAGLVQLHVTADPFVLWQFAFFGGTNGPQVGPSADFDGDGQNNLNEFLSGTDPTNSASAFRILSIVRHGLTNVVTWQSAPGQTNVLQAGGLTNYTDITAPFIITTSPTNYSDTAGATNAPARFYRVRLPVP